MSTISEFIKDHSTGVLAIKELPLMHSCDGFSTRQIIEDKELKTCDCPVFHENLLYFFYGKPAYPVSEKVGGNRSDNEYLPVCFIIPFSNVIPYKVFPFDTGAYDAKLYNKHLHHKMNICNFEMDITLDEIKQYIKLFFDNNDNYLRGDPSSIADVDDPYIDGLISIHNTTGEEEIDERANTIEVICNRNIGICDNVACIIMPDTLKRSKKINAFLKKHSEIECKTYAVRRLTAPDRYNEIVFQRAMDYLGEKGII